ncbi:gamma-glutamyl-phosphate reductase, partial [Vibrio parahaemolyticus]|nr:gamma-glutamyl-phosphate reductase [Vibrio parahaemolyticus]
CNSLDTLLVHEKVAAKFLPMIVEWMSDKVTFVAEPKAKARMAQATQIRDAVEGDFDTEWLRYTLGVKVVADVKEAI